jgi:hypothetical protein
MHGKLAKPIKVLSCSGAYGHVIRFDPGCLYPYTVEFSPKAQLEHNVPALATYNLYGQWCESAPDCEWDITHFFVGKEKRPIAELDLMPEIVL